MCKNNCVQRLNFHDSFISVTFYFSLLISFQLSLPKPALKWKLMLMPFMYTTAFDTGLEHASVGLDTNTHTHVSDQRLPRPPASQGPWSHHVRPPPLCQRGVGTYLLNNLKAFYIWSLDIGGRCHPSPPSSHPLCNYVTFNNRWVGRWGAGCWGLVPIHQAGLIHQESWHGNVIRLLLREGKATVTRDSVCVSVWETWGVRAHRSRW